MSGNFWAWSTLMIGIICGGYAWKSTSQLRLVGVLDQLLRIGFSAMVSLAVFSNLAFLVWLADFPLAMGIVEQGRMSEHYWLGPFVGVYAVLMWIMLKRVDKKN